MRGSIDDIRAGPGVSGVRMASTAIPSRRHARGGLLPAGGAGGHVLAVAGSGVPDGGGQPLRQRPVRLVLPVRRHRVRAPAAARAGDHGHERPAGRERHVEHVHAAAGGAAGAGDAAGRPAVCPQCSPDGGLRRIRDGHVRRAAPLGCHRGERGDRRSRLRLLPGPGPLRHRPLRPAVRGVPAAHHRRRPAAGAAPGRRGTRRPVAGPAGHRTAADQRGDPARHGHRRPRDHHRDRRQPAPGGGGPAQDGGGRAGRGGRGDRRGGRLPAVGAVFRPAQPARHPVHA